MPDGTGCIGRFYLNHFKNEIEMKELLKVLEGDIRDEGFTMKEVVIYGIFAPVVLVVGCLVGELINAL